MTQAASRLEHDTLFHQTARVVGREEDSTWRVHTAAGELCAKRAVSCLAAPQPGDRIALATSAGGEAWIMGVLEREGDGELCLDVDGDVRLRAPRLRLDGAAELRLSSAGEVGVTTSRLALRAVDTQLLLDRVNCTAEVLVSQIERVKSFGKSLDQSFGRLSQRLKRSFRHVEDIDRLKAGHIDHVADTTLSLRSEHTVVTADGLVKVDGKQVHLG